MASAEVIADRIERYEAAYFDELRKGMADHHVAAAAFPEFFQGFNRIVATLGRDGVVVVHWRAEQDSFRFHHDPSRTFGEILKDEGIGELDYRPGERPAAFTMQAPHWIMDTGEKRPMTELEWKTVKVGPDTDAATWSEGLARIQAQTDVSTFADAYLMGVDVTSVEPDRRVDTIVGEIEETTRKFEEFLNANPSKEQIKTFLTTRRAHILLHRSAQEVTTDKPFGSHAVDLVAKGPGGQYILIDVGSTQHPMVTSEGADTENLVHAKQRVETWLDWCGRRDNRIEDVLPDFADVEGWIVMGRRSDVALEHRHLVDPIRGKSGRIRVKTYDDLLDFARQQINERRALEALRAGPVERLVQQLLPLVPKNIWFAPSEPVRVIVQAFRVYRVPFGTMPVLPSTPLVMDFESIRVRALMGRDVILYPDPESFHLFPAPSGSFEEGTQEVWIVTSEGEFVRTTEREMWRSTKDGTVMLLITPSMTDEQIGEVPNKVLPAVRENLAIARSAITATLGQNAVFEQLFELDLRSTQDASQVGGVTSDRISPTTFDIPRMDGSAAEMAKEVVERSQALDDETRGRVLLTMRWYLLAQRHRLAQDESDTDIFVSYWVALEALAMPNTTNISPIRTMLGEIHNMSTQQVNDTFPIGRIFGLRGRILHQGHVPELGWELLVFMDDLIVDILLHILDLKANPKTKAYLDGSAKGYLPS